MKTQAICFFATFSLCILLTAAQAVTTDTVLQNFEKPLETNNADIKSYSYISIKKDTNGALKVYAGFYAKSLTKVTPVPDTLRTEWRQKTIVDIFSVTDALLKDAENYLSSNNCKPTRISIATAIQKAVTNMAEGATACFDTRMEVCKSEQVVADCLKPGTATIQSQTSKLDLNRLNWEAFLAPEPKVTDSMGGLDDNGDNFNIFTKLLRFSGLYDAVIKAKGFTLMLPSDDAVIRTAMYLIGMKKKAKHVEMERDTYDGLIQLATKGWTKDGVTIKGKDLVKLFVAYHIIVGSIDAALFKKSPFYINTATTLPIYSIGTGEIIDLSPHTPNPAFVYKDIPVVNGVIVHTINHVLIPFHVEIDHEKLHKCDC